jgi:hypothetical protein
MDPEIIEHIGYDEKLPHHYIFGVCIRDMWSRKPGEIYLKYGPIYFNNKDIEKIRNVVYRVNDEVFKQTESESLKIENCSGVVHSIMFMKMSCNANNCTMHHMSSEIKLTDEDIITFVNSCNYSKESKNKLMEAKL